MSAEIDGRQERLNRARRMRRRTKLAALVCALALASLALIGMRAPAASASTGLVERVWDVPGSPYRPGEPVVALTFDDGPDPTYTPQVLDILRQHQAPATFFAVGSAANAYPALTSAIAADGHSLANHTWSHRDLRTVSESGYAHEIGTTARLLESYTGEPVRCTRPPYGAVNSTVVSRLAARGQATVMWSSDSLDWRRPGVNAVIRNALAGLGPGSIILMHDGGGPRGQTVAALPQIIQAIRARGYQLVPICGGQAHRPFGRVELLQDLGGGLRVVGWAIDPDTTAPIQAHVYIDGVLAGAPVAEIPRPDVDAAFGKGANHGLDVPIPTSAGLHQVCVFGINVGAGFGNTSLGCSVLGVSPSAMGHLDSVSWVRGEGLRLRGWAADPDAGSGPVAVHAYVATAPFDLGSAAIARPDVARVLSWAGPDHGFDVMVPAPPLSGGVTVCAYAINVGRGISNAAIGCRAVHIHHEPIGSLDHLSWDPRGGIRVAGWAADPDAPAEPTEIHLYIGAEGRGLGPAAAPRPDVALAHPWSGPDHGFDTVVPFGERRAVEVCAYGVNVGPGAASPLLGCGQLAAA